MAIFHDFACAGRATATESKDGVEVLAWRHWKYKCRWKFENGKNKM